MAGAQDVLRSTMERTVERQIEALRLGPGAVWAPPPALAGLLEQPVDVLFVGGTLPWAVETTLLLHGHRIERAATLRRARAMLCIESYRVALADPVVPDAGLLR